MNNEKKQNKKIDRYSSYMRLFFVQSKLKNRTLLFLLVARRTVIYAALHPKEMPCNWKQIQRHFCLGDNEG